jgi:hypothetical protein
MLMLQKMFLDLKTFVRILGWTEEDKGTMLKLKKDN